MGFRFNEGAHLYNTLVSMGIYEALAERFGVRRHRSSIVKFDPFVSEPWDTFEGYCEEMDESGFLNHLLISHENNTKYLPHARRLRRRVLRETFMPKIWRAFNYGVRCDCVASLHYLFLGRTIDGVEAIARVTELPIEVQQTLSDFMVQVRPVRLVLAKEYRTSKKHKAAATDGQLPLQLKAWLNVMIVGPAYFRIAEMYGVYTNIQMSKMSERVTLNRRDREMLISGTQQGIVDDPVFLSPAVASLIDGTKRSRRRLPRRRSPPKCLPPGTPDKHLQRPPSTA